MQTKKSAKNAGTIKGNKFTIKDTLLSPYLTLQQQTIPQQADPQLSLSNSFYNSQATHPYVQNQDY